MKSEFEIAITQLSADRNLSPEVIIEAIEAALVTAYKKNYSANQAVRVTLDRHTGQAQVFVSYSVVEEPDPEIDGQITLEEALKLRPDAQLGDVIEEETMPRNFGRIAAQTAKQVITQRIREAERDFVYQEYADRQGEIVTATVRNVDQRSRNVVMNMGKAEAVMPRNEQIPGERYRFNQRVRVFISEVGKLGSGPQIVVSRTHKDLLRRLLELEVPEITTGTVEVKAIAREPGARSKVAVTALQAGVDPVGSCVGMRGVRIQNIVNELNGEKIDVVQWDAELEQFIANALSPAKVVSVILDKAENTAKVIVPDRSLSLAIGKEGQNARLAAKLTGWRIDIRSEAEAAEELAKLAEEKARAEAEAAEMAAARAAAAELLAQAEALIDDEVDEEESAAEPVEAVAEEAVADDASEAVEEAAVEAVEEAAVEAVEEAAVEAVEEAIAETVAEEPETAAEELVAEELVAEEEAVEETVTEPEPVAVAEAEAEAAGDAEPESSHDYDDAFYTEAGDFEADAEYSPEEDEESGGGRRNRSRKDRTLEYDERLGRVVARKKHKRGGNQSWQDWDGDDDEGWS